MDKSLIGKWMYNLNKSETWYGEEYNTKEEAIQAGRKEIKEEKLTNISFEVGCITEVFVSGINVDSVLEDVAENTIADIGDVGEDYLDDVTAEHKQELEEKLNKVLFAWIEKHNYQPNFFKIEKIEKVYV